MNNRDCEHGQLARSCDVCERDERIRELQTERDALVAYVERLKEGLHQALVHWGYHCTPEDEAAYRECLKRCDEDCQAPLAAHDAALLRKLSDDYIGSSISARQAFIMEAKAIERGDPGNA